MITAVQIAVLGLLGALCNLCSLCKQGPLWEREPGGFGYTQEAWKNAGLQDKTQPAPKHNAC